MASKSLTDRVSMEHLRLRFCIRNLEDDVRQRRLRWYGHVQRMTDDLGPKKVSDPSSISSSSSIIIYIHIYREDVFLI